MNGYATGEGLMQKELTILLVEDDDGDALAVKRGFRKVKVANEIVRAVDGVEAMSILRGADGKSRLKPPYVLLIDINMPRMNGVEFLRELRADAELRTSVVFVLTTSRRDEDRLAAYRLNVAGYIVKQSAGAEYIRLVELMERYGRIVELP